MCYNGRVRVNRVPAVSPIHDITVIALYGRAIHFRPGFEEVEVRDHGGEWRRFSPSDLREAANALLELCDQVEGK